MSITTTIIDVIDGLAAKLGSPESRARRIIRRASRLRFRAARLIGRMSRPGQSERVARLLDRADAMEREAARLMGVKL